MDEHSDYLAKLQTLIIQKTEWYNTQEFPHILEKYRILYTCVKNIYDQLIQKQIITEDPYKLDRKISEIQAPDGSPFNESERNLIMGTRFSEYETMLDFVCTYIRFSVETTTLPKIKKLQELNATFGWEDLSSNSASPNTRGLAMLINELRTSAPQIVQSLLTDYMNKCAQYTNDINQDLNKIIRFQREIYKTTIRKNLLEHPSFNRTKAFENADSMLAEIKRVFSDVMGKKTPFYTELINEVIAEDTAPNKESLRENVLASLQIKETNVKEKKKTVDTRAILMAAVTVLGALAPTYQTILSKLEDNVKLIQEGNNSFFAKLRATFRKLFHIGPKEVKITIAQQDPVTKRKVNREVRINELLEDMNKKNRIYNGISSNGPEIGKIAAASDSQVSNFLGKQISENQNLYNLLLSLDEYFKTSVPAQNKFRVKGMKIDLDTMRNTIINANKKRGEYQAILEEAEQMRKLGISND